VQNRSIAASKADDKPMRLRTTKSAMHQLVVFIRRKPLGAIGGGIVLVMVFACALAPVLAKYPPNQVISTALLHPPSTDYWFGTDNLGRDVFSRVLWGGRTSLFVGFVAVLISTVIGTCVGTVSGFSGGIVDLLIQRLIDALLAFPGLVLMLTIMTVLRPGLWSVAATIGVLSSVGYVRVVRSAVLAVRAQPYIEAARVLGCTPTRTVVVHVLPNIASTVVVIASIGLSAAVLIESSLSFLGFGVPPPDPTWGQMLGANARPYLLDAPWMAVWPGVALSAAVFGFNMLGDALRDVFDPRTRGAA
jgi:peptide/nickel transport system permease protein